MTEFKLETKERKTGAQSLLTKIRKQSLVPAVVYGYEMDAVNVAIDYNSLIKIITQAGKSNIIDLKVGDKTIKVIVRDFQQDPVTDKVTHVDFYAVNDKRVLTTSVPIDFVGESRAVREQGGKLFTKLLSVNVRCLPGDLPSKIDADISTLENLNDSMKVKDLKVSDKVTVLDEANAPVASVATPKKIELTPLETETAASEGAEGEGAEGSEGEGAEGEEGKKEEADKAEDKKE